MSVRAETSGCIASGKLILRNRTGFQTAVSKLRDGEYLVSVERKHATRSLPANAYYWKAIVGLLSDYTGYTEEEMHDYFKRHFLPRAHARDDLVIIDTNGKRVDEFCAGALTTTHLTKPEFYTYCENIRLWSHLTVLLYIPTPDEASKEIAADYKARFDGLLDEGVVVLENGQEVAL